MLVRVRHPRTGVESTVKSYDPEKRIIALDSGVTIIDTRKECQYYHERKKKWFQCFK